MGTASEKTPMVKTVCEWGPLIVLMRLSYLPEDVGEQPKTEILK
jgi:hypothetical protein